MAHRYCLGGQAREAAFARTSAIAVFNVSAILRSSSGSLERITMRSLETAEDQIESVYQRGRWVRRSESSITSTDAVSES